MQDYPTVIIIGGGVIGCSIAYELAKKGVKATLLDKGPLLSEASIAAAGMLAAQVETHSPGPFFELCKASRQMYRNWTRELYDYSGIDPQYRSEGIIRVALTEEDEQELQSRLPWIGQEASWLAPQELRQLEPALTDKTRGGLYFADDHQVHAIQLGRSLQSALARLGCAVKEHSPAVRLIMNGHRVTGVETAAEKLSADYVILAAGAWSPALLGPLNIQLPVFPVKGQCYSVRPKTPIIRKTVFTHGCYAVPKLDGTLTIGATQENAGFDRTATVQAIASIDQTAAALLPALREAQFVSTWTGLRPGTPDELPYLGQLPDVPGLVFATGHFRNGILLAPMTGCIVSQLVLQEDLSADISAYSPARAVVHHA
jgi:glycine oxidase